METKREIGYLPEESYLYKYLTAEETLDFFGSLFNLSAADRKKRIDQLLEMVGMAHARRRRVGEFSKGMARRIGLAQAMINDPAFLVLDEPTSGLDPIGCREVKDLILTLKKRGKTVLVTSHLLSDVEDVCDRVIILYGGKIRGEGALDELLTVSGEDRIMTPTLPKPVMDKVLEILRANLQGEEFKIDHPRRTLEDFFLDVIAQANSESVETSGAVNSGKIADYLVNGDDKNAVLENLLAAPEAPADNAKTAATPEQPVAGTGSENNINTKLQSAMAEVSAGKAEEKADTAQQNAEELKAANAKLDSLLNLNSKDEK